MTIAWVHCPIVGGYADVKYETVSAYWNHLVHSAHNSCFSRTMSATEKGCLDLMRTDTKCVWQINKRWTPRRVVLTRVNGRTA